MRLTRAFEGDVLCLELLDPRRMHALDAAVQTPDTDKDKHPVSTLFRATIAGLFRKTMLEYHDGKDVHYGSLLAFGKRKQEHMPTVRAVMRDLDHALESSDDPDLTRILAHVRDRIAEVAGRAKAGTSYGFLQWLRLRMPEKRFIKALGFSSDALEKRRDGDVLGTFGDLLKALKGTGHFRRVKSPTERWNLPIVQRAARSYLHHAVEKGQDPLSVALIELLEIQGFPPTVEAFERMLGLPRLVARKLAKRMPLSLDDVSGVLQHLRDVGFAPAFLDRLTKLWEQQPTPKHGETFGNRVARSMQERGWDSGDVARMLRIQKKADGKPSQYVRLALERDAVTPYATFAQLAAVTEQSPHGVYEALEQKRRELKEALVTRWPNKNARVFIERQLFGVGIDELPYDEKQYKSFERGTAATPLREADVLEEISIRGIVKVREAVASAVAEKMEAPFDVFVKQPIDELIRVHSGAHGYRWKKRDSAFVHDELFAHPSNVEMGPKQAANVDEQDIFGAQEHGSDQKALQHIALIAKQKRATEIAEAKALRPLSFSAVLQKGSLLVSGGFAGIHAATDTRGIERCHHLSAKELTAIAHGKYRGLLPRESVKRVVVACGEQWTDELDADLAENTALILSKRHKNPLVRVLHGTVYEKFPSLHAFHRQTQMSKKVFDRTIAKIHEGAIAWERVAQILTEADVRFGEPLWDFVEQLWRHGDLPRALRRWKKIAGDVGHPPSGVTKVEFINALFPRGRATR